jgi:hypothetical protein
MKRSIIRKTLIWSVTRSFAKFYFVHCDFQDWVDPQFAWNPEDYGLKILRNKINI